MTLTVLDRTGSAYQLTTTVLADGRPHVLVASLGGDKALYPFRVASITVTFGEPLRAVPTLALTLSGPSLAGWTQQATSPDPIDFQPGQFFPPADGPTHVTGGTATFTFSAGHAPPLSASTDGPDSAQHVPAQLLMLRGDRAHGLCCREPRLWRRRRARRRQRADRPHGSRRRAVGRLLASGL